MLSKNSLSRMLGSDIIKAGFTAQNKQRYRCRNAECEKMHDIVIGLLTNSLEFGCDIHAKIQV